jgi:hypothetical protein
VGLQAQNIKVSEFRLLEKDMTANTHGTQKLDQNGEKAALIKVQAPEQGFTFSAGSLGIVSREDQNGEIWLYVPRKSKKLTVQHNNYNVLREYYYPIPIEGGRTYEMYIDIGIGRYVTIASERANSTIYIDGENCGTSPISHRYLTYGRHNVRAIKDRYEGEMNFVITTEDAPLRLINIEQRDMSDHFGDVTVNVDNKADIYFEGKKMGTSSWKTQLREGTYIVETRKADCDPVKTSFTVVAQKNNVFKANAPTPHTGWLSVYTRPGNVKTIYNGDHFIDLSETVSLPIGSYQIEFSRKGFETQNHEYVVRHNQTTADTVTLSRISYIKPTCFYFGPTFTASSLPGIGGVLGVVFRNHDLQLSYSYGIVKSHQTNWFNSEGHTVGASTHTLNTFAVRYGYQIPLLSQFALVPQLGYALNMLKSKAAGTLENYADGAKASILTIGAKIVYAPFKHFYLFAAPEIGFALSKDDDYSQAAKKANFSEAGFTANIGVLLNF